jgi:hypothetical protein
LENPNITNNTFQNSQQKSETIQHKWLVHTMH